MAYQRINREDVPDYQLREELAQYLLGFRMHNYGYGLKDWRRICRQRYLARKLLKINGADLQLATAHSRLTYNVSSGWDYTVGQSANEEITNLIMYLSERK